MLARKGYKFSQPQTAFELPFDLANQSLDEKWVLDSKRGSESFCKAAFRLFFRLRKGLQD